MRTISINVIAAAGKFGSLLLFIIGTPMTFFNWTAGEPNNQGGNEHYIVVNSDGYWNDEDAKKYHKVLCQNTLKPGIS